MFKIILREFSILYSGMHSICCAQQSLLFGYLLVYFSSHIELGGVTGHNIKQLKKLNAVVFPISYTEKVRFIVFQDLWKFYQQLPYIAIISLITT